MSIDYESIPTGGGEFVTWTEVGQVVEGIIIGFTVDGGSDFNDNACPEVTIRQLDGALATVTCGTAQLKKAMTLNADKMRLGHQIRIEFTGTYKTNKGSDGKSFSVGVSPQPVMDDISSAISPDEEPF